MKHNRRVRSGPLKTASQCNLFQIVKPRQNIRLVLTVLVLALQANFSCRLDCAAQVPPPSTGGTYYYVAKSGSDLNPCTLASPCLTIKKGVSKAIHPGDTVTVMAGTYVEFVASWFSGAQGKPITVRANPGDTVVWRSSGTNQSSLSGIIHIADRRFIRIQGFRFENCVARTAIRVRNSPTSKTNPVQGIAIVDNTFVNNGNNGVLPQSVSRPIYFQHAGHTAFVSGDDVNTISGNIFDGNYGYHIQLLSSNDTIISNNVCRNAKSSLDPTVNTYVTHFIHVGGGATRNIIQNNTVSTSTTDSYVRKAKYNAQGIKLDAGAVQNTIRWNLIHDLAGNADGIMIESRCNNNQVYENIVYAVVDAAYRNGGAKTYPAEGNIWKNNVAFDCGCGMRLSRSKNIVVKNNIFAENSIAQISVSSEAVASGGNIFSNNDYFKAGSTLVTGWNVTDERCPAADKNLGQWSPLSGDANSLSVDPKFVSPPSNFHLQSKSALKDKGENGVDMGAYPGNPGINLTISGEGQSPIAVSPPTSKGLRDRTADGSLRPTALRRIAGFESAKLDAMIDALANHNTRSLLLIQDSQIVREWYAWGQEPMTPQDIGSLATSLVAGVSLMVALNDGLIASNDFASKYIPSWRSDPAKSQIRIRHLASHTSGIENTNGCEEWKRDFRKPLRNPFTIALAEAPILFSPGTDATYSNAGIAALTYAITRSLKNHPQTDIRTLIQERILDPLGVSESEWSIGGGISADDGMKLYASWADASYTPRAIAKVGLLMLNHGRWRGKQLVASNCVDEIVSPSTQASNSGLCWWTNLGGQWPSLPRDAFAGAGSDHQLLLVVPSLKLVVVRSGGSLMREDDFWAGLEEYVFSPLMRAIDSSK